MLTSLSLKDYATFITETLFDFNATNYKILESTNVGENRVLKGALFVGENASGKTQTIDAIKILLNLLFDNSEYNYKIKKSLYTKGDKFSLSYTFNVDDSIIKYEIKFVENNICSEKLYVNDKLKLDRLNTSGQTYFNNERETFDLNPSLPLLKLEYYNTKFNNDKLLNKWFEFLKNSMYINCLFKEVKTYNMSNLDEQSLVNHIDKNGVGGLNKLMNDIGYNSELVYKKKRDKDVLSVNSLSFDLSLRKIGTDVDIPFFLESAGNKAFINLILPIQFAINHDCMLIADEFSSGLHNELEESLIKYFFNNSKNSQLFFVFHSTNLIDTTILRPDQIYSFKFDSKKGTVIKRFSDENPRESQNMEKMYLNGVFDGMPKYNKEFKIQ